MTDNNNNEILFETDIYKVIFNQEQPDDPIEGYAVVNKKFNIVEEKSYNLPKLIMYAVEASRILDTFLSEEVDELESLEDTTPSLIVAPH